MHFVSKYDSNNKKRFINKTYTRILVQIVKVETVSNFNNFLKIKWIFIFNYNESKFHSKKQSDNNVITSSIMRKKYISKTFSFNKKSHMVENRAST